MAYYSHADGNEKRNIGSKLLKDHFLGVYNKSIESLNKYVKIDFDHEELPEIILDLSRFHDLGKYTSYFQNYLLGTKKVNRQLSYHSQIGAFVILNKYKYEPLLAAFLYFILASHHANFDDILKSGLRNDSISEDYIFENQLNDLKGQLKDITNETEIPSLNEIIEKPDLKTFRKVLKKHLRETPEIRNYFTINYLFSLLIESDKLDASNTNQYIRNSINEKAINNLLGNINLNNVPKIEDISTHEQNLLRNFVRASVLKNIYNDDILNHKLFTLTAPTGIGKTLTSLDFALHLKRKIREAEYYEPQIIYGLPFINIIEQALHVYTNEVFKNETESEKIKILAHYQYADIFDTGNAKMSYNQELMSLDTWQSDIVITSFVQFFETLISNRNKLLLKFNHMAGAIVILDEVQTIRLEQLPLIGAILFHLTQFLNTRLILMTATKPKIFELANHHILNSEELEAKPVELLADYKQVFQKFNRTRIIPLIQNPIEKSEEFIPIFNEKRPSDKSCLIVCNKVQRAIDIFNELENQNIKPLYCLSTNIVPAERFAILQKIKEELSKGKHPVLVSTQVIEAGVDLDFDMGFRDIAPIDSIIQVAGRINRENKKSGESAPLYILEFIDNKGRSECAQIYDTLTRTQAFSSLRNKTEIPEMDYLQLIESYFDKLSAISAFSEAKTYYHSVKILRYDSEDKADKPISEFKIIKSIDWATPVFIELNEMATNALNAYLKLLDGEMEKEVWDRKFKKIFNQFIIAVPDKFTNHLEQLHPSVNTMLVRRDNLEENYIPQTGFIRKREQTYSML